VTQSGPTDELARFRIDGKVAVVAGGAGAIGSRLARALAGAGANVAVVNRSMQHVQPVVEQIEAQGGKAFAVAGDLTRKADVDEAMDAIAGHFGRLDIVVHAVGGGAGGALYPAEEYSPEEFDRIFDLNFTSDLLVTQACARQMIKFGNGGHVLHISSVRGQLGINAGYLAYVAAKGAINSITRQQATEWAKYNINVNAIAPTFVRTPQVESMLADENFYNGLVKRIPLNRIADTDDLVGAVLFFCSDASSFVTGQILTLDGGLTATQ
jgi:gluconate 5-dehydrogenase